VAWWGGHGSLVGWVVMVKMGDDGEDAMFICVCQRTCFPNGKWLGLLMPAEPRQIACDASFTPAACRRFRWAIC